MMCSPLKRNLDDVSFRVRGLPGGVGGSAPVLPWRLDLDDLVLLTALGVHGCLKHHHTLATDEVFWTPPEFGVYLPCDCDGPLVSVSFGGRAHARKAHDLGVLSIDLEGPHEALSELRLLLLDVHQLGVVSAVLKNLLHLHIHPETQCASPSNSLAKDLSTFKASLMLLPPTKNLPKPVR